MPSVGCHFPTGHALQLTEPGALNSPHVHGVHVSEYDCSVAALARPAAQLTHVALPHSLCQVPPAHFSHVVAPAAGAKLPGAQGLQSEATSDPPSST